MDFIWWIWNASLGDGMGLGGESVNRLCNPLMDILKLVDPCQKLAIQIFITLEHSLESGYEKIRIGIHACFPGSELPSFYQVKHLLVDLTGVMSIINHMCINSCTTFVGPYAHLDTCPECDEPHYDQLRQNRGVKHPHAVFHTIPIGPQLQALW
ncbi:hypothetical protein F5J12DRAFT_786832 [Pisolithus orientalis]|uniref:uncharacterized protein n=1 Tax=Pisolithus orientalis TaxID=936130 RepID=UPI00222584A3|nr:uncharacterized protein F5J12DRAFT_786832 [Pisolithus orientalis]KAI5988653.1 hypothetical protein F5J12DRAFT_786832 [Pisolithus orientalis]